MSEISRETNMMADFTTTEKRSLLAEGGLPDRLGWSVASFGDKLE